tara:strand:+ start:389 stop:1171 length:783 start_codon:yes stop_codon:yes gene_type:complete
MQICQLSRLSFNLFLKLWVSCGLLFAQQKSNDFTKRLGFFEGKQSNLSGKFYSSPKLSDAFSKRIKIQDWPTRFSPFGGKRFTTRDIDGLIKKRIPLNRVKNERVQIPGKIIGEENRASGMDIEGRYTSTATVEFRDAHYAKLNQRMDEWMEKVNNLSLRDINRFQFRKGRSAESGFPVQRAGSSLNNLPASKFPSPGAGNIPKLPSNYRIGPRKVPSKTTSPPSPNFSSPPVESRRKSPLPVPKLGPKKIRVQVQSIQE